MMTLLLAFAVALATYTALLLLTRVIPRPLIFDLKPWGNANAKNFLFIILINPELKKQGVYSAILAQEIYEWQFKRHPKKGIEKQFSVHVAREMEIMGHEIEVQEYISSGGPLPIHVYRLNEARALTRYEQFNGYGEEKIYQLMTGVTDEAGRWLDQEYPKIKPVYVIKKEGSA